MCEVIPNKVGETSAVLATGPTVVRIRSGKHDSSIAFSHATDVREVLSLDISKGFVCDSAGIVKPVLMFSVDGGPDEMPRSDKVHAVHSFC